jgi:tetratricopeptide (TPR) repeat protein
MQGSERRDIAVFLTQEKALKRVQQDRMRGDRKKALEKALSALEKWPSDFDIAMEAIQLCLDISDFKEAVTLMKSTIRRHPKSRQQLISIARESLHNAFNPFLASFVIEFLIRSRDFDSARQTMRAGPATYIDGMIKRSETRSKGFEESGNKKTSTYTENELLLGLLFLEARRWADAAEPLGRALKSLPDEAQVIGAALLEADRECHDNSRIQYYLGIASILLSHPDKAEARFFHALELDDPPAMEVLKILEAEEARSKNWLMMQGEALISSGMCPEGTARIREYLAAKDGGWDQKETPGDINQLFPEEVDRQKFALERLEKLPENKFDDFDVSILYCEIASAMEKVKETVDTLKMYFGNHRDSAARLAEWIVENETVSGSSPGQELLARLNLHLGRGEPAAAASGIAAEMDPSRIPSIIEMVKIALEAGFEDSAPLQSILAELYARGGNEERASELIREMESDDTLEKDELMRLSGEVLKHCGVSLDGVISTIELSIRNSRVAEALPYSLEFYRENPDARGLLAEKIAGIAEEDPGTWPALAELCELFAAEEDLDRSMRFLRAKSHMKSGQIERAIFEFDQLMMFDDSLRSAVTGFYEEAAGDNPDNTTLHLALYQIYFEDERFASAARHLGRAMETDPGQIRDIVPQFEKIVERDPANRAAWDEMLGSAMKIRHFDLARDLLKKAVQALPEHESAALHIFGARIAANEGNIEDALRCIAMTLSSTGAELGAVRSELAGIIEKDSSSAEARYMLGETMLRLGSEDEAIAELERCISLSPAYLDRVGQRLEKLLPVSIKPWLISRILGEIHWAGSRRDEAIRYLESAQKGPQESLPRLNRTLKKIAASSPDDTELSFIYARNLARTEGYDEAAGILATLISANASLSAGAASVLQEIIDKKPGHLNANALLASILSAADDSGRAVDALLRIASIESASEETLIDTIEPFLEKYGEEPRLLVPLGGLRGRAGNQKQSLDELEKALALDDTFAKEILDETLNLTWTKKYVTRASLLDADCNIVSGNGEAAFSILEEVDAGTKPARARVMERLHRLIGAGPKKEYYEFASQLLSGGGDTKGAESILREGIDALGHDVGIDLLITMGGIFEAAGMEEKAAGCFREVLESSGDRHRILVRIEKAWTSWKEREIRTGLERIEAGETGAEEAEKLIITAIETGDLGSAGRMIDAGGLEPLRRKALLSRLHLSAGRILSALAVAGSAPREGGDEESIIELLYVEGTASELLGDHGRAASAFSRILGIRSEYLDSAGRAQKAYARYIASQCEEKSGLLVATGDLETEN